MPPGHDDLHLADRLHLLQRAHRLGEAREGRDAGVVEQDVGGRAGTALHPVDHEDVRSGLDRELHVVGHARGPHLHVDRDLPLGGLAHLFDLELQIVGADEVGVAHRRTLVHALRQRALLRDHVRDLRAEQEPARAGLRALPDHDLDRLRHLQVLGVEPVPGREHLVDHVLDLAALLDAHPAVARRGGDPGPLRGAAERGLRVGRERPVGHPGDRDRAVEHDRVLGEACAEDGLRRALLAVALQRDARQRARHERQVIEGRHLAVHREPHDPVPAELGLGLDVLDHVARPHGRFAEHRQGAAGRLGLAHRSSPSRLQRRLPQLRLLRREVPELAARAHLREVEGARVDPER